MSSIDEATSNIVRQFNDAMNRKDLATLRELIATDCVFEDTEPAPDGTKYFGADAVAAYMTDFLNGTPDAKFTEEEMICAGDRCIVRSRFDWAGGHVRGAQIMRVKDGKVSELFAYVKG